MAVDLNYGIGVEGKNLVLKTLGRVYVKVKDRKYELLFRPEDYQELFKETINSEEDSLNNSSFITVDSSTNLESYSYPGDNVLVLTKDGYIYVTENNDYTQIPLQFSGENLSLQNLTINGQITFMGNSVPFIVPSNLLINNLNADLLDGYHVDAFARKNNNEIIDGSWTYNGLQTFENAIGKNALTDPEENKIRIDFKTGTITCNVLSTKQIYESNENVENPQFDWVSGIGQEVWIGSQINILKSREIETLEFSPFFLVQDAYENEELPAANPVTGTIWDLEDFWYNQIFFNSWDAEGNYTLKDFSDQTVWDAVNANFDGTKYSLTNFQNLIYALMTPDHSQFSGEYIEITIPDNIDVLAILPNMIVKSNLSSIGYVVERSGNLIVVQSLSSDEIFEGDQLIVIGSLCQKGGIVFSANNPSLSILKDPLDLDSYSIYFGQLSKIDKNKSGIGMLLKGTYPENVVLDNNISSIQDYIHTSEINIENSYLKWVDKDKNPITIFNEDGSGYLSQGQIRWSANNDLLINDSKITNSSFQSGGILINKDGSGNIGDLIKFNTTAITLNSPLGAAGGDLQGNYPNPEIKNACITKDKLSEEVLNLIESGSSDIIERLENVESSINQHSTILNNLQSTIDQHTTEITNINSTIATIQSDIEELKNSGGGGSGGGGITKSEVEDLITEHINNLDSSFTARNGYVITEVSLTNGTLNGTDTRLSTINGHVLTDGDSITISGEGGGEPSGDWVSKTDFNDLEERVTALENTVGTLNTMLENRLNGN